MSTGNEIGSVDEGPLPHSIDLLRLRLEEPSVQSALKGFTRTLQVTLTDLEQDYLFTIADGHLSRLERKRIVNADVGVIVASSLMEAILKRASNGILAYFTGKMKIMGTMEDMLRLQKIMG